MALTIILFFLGFLFLIKGADILINASSAVAKQFKISPWIIGLTVVGIGTSLPELVVALMANLKEASGVSFGVVIGSNIFNLLLILGLAAIINPIIFKKEWVYHDLPINFSVILVVILLIIFNIGGADNFLGISRLAGALLLLLFFAWFYFLIKRKKDYHYEETVSSRVYSWPKAFSMIVLGITGTIIGGEWVVNGSIFFAEILDLPKSIIGLTIISIGSSLPELFITIIAALKKQAGLAVGNIIGSNIFDFLAIIGIVALVKPMAFSSNLKIDLLIALFASFLILFFTFIGKHPFWEKIFGKKYILNRWQGVVMILFYIFYLYSLILRT